MSEIEPFEEGDFHCVSEGLSRDPQYNDRRLRLRRKLGALGKAAVADLKREGIDLLSRTSLHQPHTFNGMRVRRLWVYICRSKKAKGKLRRTLGSDLVKDLDTAYKNAYLCAAVEADALEISFRIHPDAWYDGQNIHKRVAREGIEGWLEVLNQLPGYHLKLDNWAGEWPLGSLGRDQLEEFLRFWKPGEHGLSVERRWPATGAAREALFDPQVPQGLLDELSRLAPLYRFGVWSDESNFLFG